jgi:NADH dehydrogenase FAD-containing subunit
VDARGGVKVDEHLRLQGASNVFVLGDLNDTPQGKLGFLADLQADLTVANLNKIAAKGEAAKLGKWAPPLQPKGAMFVTFGSGDGYGHLGGCFCGGEWLDTCCIRDALRDSAVTGSMCGYHLLPALRTHRYNKYLHLVSQRGSSR